MDSSSISGLRALLGRYGLTAKKMYGQNFLVDRNILHKIVDACGLTPELYAVEIGPGMGALSRELAGVARGLLAIEIDRDLRAPLEELAAECGNMELLWEDVLKVDIEAELAARFGAAAARNYVVCANIPYQITSPIVFKLLEECPRLQSATLMMQKEVAARLLASPGGRDYGRLTVTAAHKARCEKMMTVSRYCFYPPPKVDSAVVKLIPRGGDCLPLAAAEHFDALVRAAFQQRRKTLLNILSGHWEMDKGAVSRLLADLQIDPQRRPETLSVEDFVRLSNAAIRCPDGRVPDSPGR